MIRPAFPLVKRQNIRKQQEIEAEKTNSLKNKELHANAPTPSETFNSGPFF